MVVYLCPNHMEKRQIIASGVQKKLKTWNCFKCVEKIALLLKPVYTGSELV